MTDIEAQAAEKKRRLKKTAFSLGLGGVAGFIGASVAMRLLDSDSIPDVGASVEIAVLVGVMYVLTALAGTVGVVSPKAGATFLNVEDEEEWQEQRGMLLYSGIGVGLAGIALIVVALGSDVGVIDPVIALSIYVVLAVIAVWVSIRAGKLQDEFMRAVSRESAALTYYLVVLVGGTWALLAHLGFAAGPQPIDWLTMFWALLLLACFIVVAKRGMLTMR